MCCPVFQRPRPGDTGVGGVGSGDVRPAIGTGLPVRGGYSELLRRPPYSVAFPGDGAFPTADVTIRRAGRLWWPAGEPELP